MFEGYSSLVTSIVFLSDLKLILEGYSNLITLVTFSPNSKLLVLGSYNKTVKI
jgi:WD40 repeat protein